MLQFFGASAVHYNNDALLIPVEKFFFCLPHLGLCDTHIGESEPGGEGQPPAVTPMELRVKGIAQGPTHATFCRGQA